MEIEKWPQEAKELYEKIESEFENLDTLIHEHQNGEDPQAWFEAIRRLPQIADLVQCLELEYYKVKEGREIVN
tara:strand:+ start:1515 stop:1733 length:219 start_codon:yes stop_codon:yes gene_type:complete